MFKKSSSHKFICEILEQSGLGENGSKEVLKNKESSTVNGILTDLKKIWTVDSWGCSYDHPYLNKVWMHSGTYKVEYKYTNPEKTDVTITNKHYASEYTPSWNEYRITEVSELQFDEGDRIYTLTTTKLHRYAKKDTNNQWKNTNDKSGDDYDFTTNLDANSWDTKLNIVSESKKLSKNVTISWNALTDQMEYKTFINKLKIWINVWIKKLNK